MAHASPLNVFRLNPNALATASGNTAANSPSPDTDFAPFGSYECEELNDPSRHARLLARVVSGYWGFGIAIWLEEHDVSASGSCDDFGRGIWPFAQGRGGSGGLGGAPGGFAPTPITGAGSRPGGAGFELVSFVTADSNADFGGDDDGIDDGPGLPYGFDTIDTPTLFALLGGPPTDDAPEQENGNETPLTQQGFTAVQQPTPVPEPSSLLLLGTGLAAWHAARRRRGEEKGREV